MLHSSLFDIKCTSFYCNYTEKDNFTDPIVPALAIPTGAPQPAPLGTANDGSKATDSLSEAMGSSKLGQMESKELDISDDRVEIPEVYRKDLPHCPKCKAGLLRPGVVWFGEALPQKTMSEVDGFIERAMKIDLMLVIGTSAKVWPAAGYINEARNKGARVCVINMDREDTPGGRYGSEKGDWFFEGDAAVIVPEILKSEIGDISGIMHER